MSQIEQTNKSSSLSSSSFNGLKIPEKEAEEYVKMIEAAETRAQQWLDKQDWTHYKTMNENLHSEYPITVHKRNENNDDITIWKAEAIVPECNIINVLKCYSIPSLRLEYETGTMKTYYTIPIINLQQNNNNQNDNKNNNDNNNNNNNNNNDNNNNNSQIIDKNDKIKENNNATNINNNTNEEKEIKEEIVNVNNNNNDNNNDSDVQIKKYWEQSFPYYVLSVVISNPAAGGWISSRIFFSVARTFYSHKTKRYCTLCTFMPNHIMQQYLNDNTDSILEVNKGEMKSYVLAKNITVYFDVESTQCKKKTKIRYILQADNQLTWIPQWVQELGVVEGHMIKLFKLMTEWLLEKKKDTTTQ